MKTLRILMLLASFAVAGSASATTVTLSSTGTLSQADAVDFLFIEVTGPTIFSAITFGYAGGTQADGNIVADGGFDPILSLFSPSGSLITSNDDGGLAVNADPVSGARFDSFISDTLLTTGNYLLAISQFSNFAIGPEFFNGFDGSGRTEFIDVFQNLRTSAYAIDVTLSTVPVPAAGILFASALLGAGVFGRRKKKAAKSEMVGAFARVS